MVINTVVNYRKKMFILIGISSVLRLIVASTVELSNAEVYYWVYSLRLQWNYFDHPPMVAWLIRLTTANLLLHMEVFVRLGAILASATCTWLIFKIGTFISNVETGWLAALLYTSSVYCSIIAGTFILPDSPQMVFWLSSFLLLLKILHVSAHNRPSVLHWCLFGLMSGLCIMSKVHGIFLWVGVALYVAISDRSWLKQRGIYLAAVISLIIVSPILTWNLQNHFITYISYSSRISLTGAGVNEIAFIRQLAAVIMITNPVNFFLICTGLVWVFKGNMPVDKKNIQLLLFCSLPLIAAVLFISLFRETLAHWPQPAYSCLLLIPAIQLAAVNRGKKHTVPNGIKLGLAFMIITAVSEIFVTNYYPGTLSEQKQGLNIGAGDDTLDKYGWKEAGKAFDSLYRNDTAKKIMPSGVPIIISKWFPAAHIDFYIAVKTKQPVIGIGNVSDLGQYYWINEYRKQLKNGDSAYFIVPSNLFDYKTFDAVINDFRHYEMAMVISQFRTGIVCKKLYVFRMKGYFK